MKNKVLLLIFPLGFICFVLYKIDVFLVDFAMKLVEGEVDVFPLSFMIVVLFYGFGYFAYVNNKYTEE